MDEIIDYYQKSKPEIGKNQCLGFKNNYVLVSSLKMQQNYNPQKIMEVSKIFAENSR